MILSEKEKLLLDAVLSVAGCDKNEIPRGIKKTLYGIKDCARRKYLWNVLSKAAKEKIQAAQRRARRMNQKFQVIAH